MKGAFGAVLVFSLGLAATFLALPLVALFVQIGPDTLLHEAGADAFQDALIVSLKTSLIAHLFVLGIGTPAAYLLATRRFRGRGTLLALVELPLVLPPAVAGIGLLYTFGRSGLLGGAFDALGMRIPFTQTAVVFAVIFVASPFYVRTAVAAFESVDPQLFDAARTLGARPARRFVRVALPLAGGVLAAGSSLAWARGLGEFGATIIFAGSLQGRTQTLPLAIGDRYASEPNVAIAIGALLVIVSIVVLVLVRVLARWQNFTSSSLIPFAASNSA